MIQYWPKFSQIIMSGVPFFVGQHLVHPRVLYIYDNIQNSYIIA